MTDALTFPTPVDPEVRRLREQRDEALDALEPRERAWVEHFSVSGNGREAAEAAGYRDPAHESLRVKRRPAVKRALLAVLRARTSSTEFSREDAIRFLRAMLNVRLADFGETNEHGVLVGLRDLEALPVEVQARVKSMSARVHRSAKGERAHYVNLEVALHSPLDILDRLARLEGWVDDSPTVRIALAAIQDPNSAPAGMEGWRLVHELADEIFDDAQLSKYLEAHASGDRVEMGRLVREELARLREQRTAIPAEVLPS